MQTFYQLLSIDSGAAPEEIKRAFRSEIAKYHPDKVQHLGKEFQEMAASRAAALTEAYRTLMNAELRADYDRTHGVGPGHASRPSEPAVVPPPPAAPVQNEPVDSGAARPGAPPSRFASERKDRDDFVRKATLDRVRQAVAAEMGQLQAPPARGFDLDFTTRAKKLFSRDSGQRFAVKVVPFVDKQAMLEAWSTAQKAAPICVFLMGSGLAPVQELAEAVSDARKRIRGSAAISVVPVDVRDWSAHVPADAPASCRSLLKRLRDTSI